MRATCSLTAAYLLSAILVAPEIAAAAHEPNPTPPAQTTQPSGSTSAARKSHKKPKTTQKSSSAEDFLADYRAAYALIYAK